MKVKEHYIYSSPMNEVIEEDQELYETALQQIADDCILPNYVILKNGQHCYIMEDCDPERNICFCQA